MTELSLTTVNSDSLGSFTLAHNLGFEQNSLLNQEFYQIKKLHVTKEGETKMADRSKMTGILTGISTKTLYF